MACHYLPNDGCGYDDRHNSSPPPCAASMLLAVPSLQLHPIVCVGQDGEARTFYVEGPIDAGGELRFRIHSRNPPDTNNDCFEARFRRLTNDTAQSVMLSHNYSQAYRRKGIPEQVILYAAEVLRSKIFSSPVISKRPGEYLVEPARKAWQRLVAQGRAVYVREKNRYETK